MSNKFRKSLTFKNAAAGNRAAAAWRKQWGLGLDGQPKHGIKMKPPVNLPKAFASEYWNSDDGKPRSYWAAHLPCRTRQEAREIVGLHGMSRIKLINLIAPIIHAEEKWAKTRVWSPSTVAQRVLQALHLIP